MSITRAAFSAIISLVFLCGVAAAQESGAAQAQAPAAATVTAAAAASGVRFVSTEGSRRIRLEVYSAAGERVYDSEFRQGSILDWDGAGTADGSYLCVVTVEDLRGASARRLSAVSIQSGRAAVRKEDEEQMKAEHAPALAAAGRTQD